MSPHPFRLAMANILAFWEMRKHAAKHWYSIMNTVLILGILEGALYLAYFEPPYLTYQNLPFPVLNNAQPGHLPWVKPGETLRLTVHRCNADSTPHIYPIARELRGGEKALILPAGQAPIAPGCEVAESRVNQVPADAKPGIYWVEGYAQVEGHLRSMVVPWRSERFEVRSE